MATFTRLATFTTALIMFVSIIQQGQASPLLTADRNPLAHFAANDPNSTQAISHRGWDRVLGIMFVQDDASGEALLDYGRLSPTARGVLKRYLTYLQTIQISNYSRDEQLAYWLNFYNAASFSQVYASLEKGSKRMSSPGRNPHRKTGVKVKSLMLKSDGPWQGRQYKVEGRRLSLTDIEHRIVHGLWNDPSVMYGLSCPAKGCPALMPRAFKANSVRAQLAASAQQFISDENNVVVRRKRLRPSALYIWHHNLFPDKESVLAHLRQIGNDRLRRQLTGVVDVKGEQFSWKLNGKKPPEDFNQPVGIFSRGSGAVNY
jgi:hypothetical protein